jgi:protease-4
LIRGLEIMTADTYLEFKTRVSDGRNMSMDEVEAIAQGKVWSAQRALEIGLIDSIGTVDDAVAKAAEIASITNFSRVYFPRRATMFEFFMEDSFNIPMARALLRRELPAILERPASEMMNLLEDVMTHPVQMRMEMVIDE